MLPVIVLLALPAENVPPVTARPVLAVSFASLPMRKVPLLEITAPVTVPLPFQFPPVTSSLPAIKPPDLLMVPLPVSVALPFTVPLPASVPAVPTATVLAASVEPLSRNVPAVTVVAPV